MLLALLSRLDVVSPTYTSQLRSLDEKLGIRTFSNMLQEIDCEYPSRVFFSGEFLSLTGGPKDLFADHLRIRKYLGVKELGDATFSIHIPLALSFLQPIYHSHNITRLPDQRQLCLATTRDPCGIFESSINSLNALASDYLSKEAHLSKSPIETIRQELALYKISGHVIRESMLSFLEKNICAYANIESESAAIVRHLSWETMIGFPGLFCKQLSEALAIVSIARDPEKILKTLQDMKYQNLLHFHKHNYRPGHSQPNAWRYDLPGTISKRIMAFESYVRYMNLARERPLCGEEECRHGTFELTSKFSRLANSLILNKVQYVPRVDRNLLEFALNKTNVDQSFFADTHIVGLRLPFLTVERMSRAMEPLVNIFVSLSATLQRIWSIHDDLPPPEFSKVDLESAIHYYSEFFRLYESPN